jgi:hypothetical protein
MKQSVEANPPPVEGRTMATTQELRHLKRGRVLPQEREAALRKAATACRDTSLRAKWKLQEKQRLTEQTL